MGDTEKTSTWRLWAGLDWCSFCTRVDPERKVVAAHVDSACPSRSKRGAVFESPFAKAFAAVKKFQESGGMAGLRVRDPDLDLGKECMRWRGAVLSDSDTEEGSVRKYTTIGEARPKDLVVLVNHEDVAVCTREEKATLLVSNGGGVILSILYLEVMEETRFAYG
jgi:hypothetical protein